MADRTIASTLNPSVPRRYLFVIAGLMWTVIGALLCWRAFRWIQNIGENVGIILFPAAFILVGMFYASGFSRIAAKKHQEDLLAGGKGLSVCIYRVEGLLDYRNDDFGGSSAEELVFSKRLSRSCIHGNGWSFDFGEHSILCSVHSDQLETGTMPPGR